MQLSLSIYFYVAECRTVEQKVLRRLIEDAAEPTVRRQLRVVPPAVRQERAVLGQKEENLPPVRLA